VSIHDKKSWLTVQATARQIRVPERTIYMWCDKCKIGEKIDGSWRVDPARLSEQLKARAIFKGIPAPAFDVAG
jgi:hypothetical protein